MDTPTNKIMISVFLVDAFISNGPIVFYVVRPIVRHINVVALESYQIIFVFVRPGNEYGYCN